MRLTAISLVALAAAASLAMTLTGSGNAQTRKAVHFPYTLVDPGTLGGPQSYFNGPGAPLTANGTLLGSADTAASDAHFPNCFCGELVNHAFAWRNGHAADLGALPGDPSNSSGVWEMNGAGIGVGGSEDGKSFDPLLGIVPQHAVMFEHGQVIDLGTLRGGYESLGQSINDRGQIAGFASTGGPDPYTLFPWAAQTHTFIWQHGVMTDIGTLGGPDAIMFFMNANGQIAGVSYTNSAPNAATGVPTLDPFLWTNGHMRDLGTLGGAWAGMGSCCTGMNDRGEVVGGSDLAGDQAEHPFLWDGKKMIDLGTLGGQNGEALSVNEAGDVAGSAGLPDGTHEAFLWKNGTMHALPPVAGASCSNGSTVNSRDDVVGNATDCHGNIVAGVLWRHGRAYDLNTLVGPSAVHVTEGVYIDDREDIVAQGVLPDGTQRMMLLQRKHGPLRPGATRVTTFSTRATTRVGCDRIPASLPDKVKTRLCGTTN